MGEPNIMDQLTNREQQVARLLAAGMDQKQIAHQLNVKACTVYRHTDNVRRKTGLTTVGIAVSVAMAGDK